MMTRMLFLCLLSFLLTGCEGFIKSLDLQLDDPDPFQRTEVQPQLETVESEILGRGIHQPVQQTDVQFAYQALHKPTREATLWRNDQTGVEFTVKPTSRFKTVDDVERCRDFRTNVLFKGVRHSFAGIACLKLNGEWEAID